MGFKIDLVVEGVGDRRLAIECDGDQYHGPERWADDMSRQRVLERVGWHFWRCWASSFTVDPDGCMADLFRMLRANGIRPAPAEYLPERYTEQRVVGAKSGVKPSPEEVGPTVNSREGGIKVGDSIVVRYLDDNKTSGFVLSRDRHDPVKTVPAGRYRQPLDTGPTGKTLQIAARAERRGHKDALRGVGERSMGPSRRYQRPDQDLG
jgi:REase_MTES_1575